MCGSAALFGPSLLILAVAPQSMPLPFLVLGWAIASFASVIYNSTTVGVRQARVPQRLRSLRCLPQSAEPEAEVA